MVNFLNNGKVLIGVYYELNPLKPKYVEYDKDMLLLQTALVGDVESIRRDKMLNALYVAVLVLGLFGAILLTK